MRRTYILLYKLKDKDGELVANPMVIVESRNSIQAGSRALMSLEERWPNLTPEFVSLSEYSFPREKMPVIHI